MAYSVSSDFTNQLYSGDSQFRATLTIGNTTIDNDQIASISISSPIIDTSQQVFYLGTFIAQKITIKFKNMNGIDVTSGDAVDLSIGQYVNNQWVDVPIGKFLVDDLAENYAEKCEISCLDYSVLFKPNIDYSNCFVDGKATIGTILQYICDECDVTLGDYPIVNDNVEIGTYDSTVSGKQWISYIAEIKGCNAKMDRLGRLTLQPLKQSQNISINALESASWTLGEKYKISQVTFYDALRNYSFGEATDNTLFIRQDNPFVVDATVVENVFDEVENFEMYSVKTHNFGDFTLDAWDNIEYSLGEDSFVTLNDNTITYNMSIMSDVDTKIPTKQQEVTTNIIGGSTDMNVKKIKTEVDNLNASVNILATQQTNTESNLTQLQLDVNGINQQVEHIENDELGNIQSQLSSVTQTANSIANMFQITGGINIIRNSAFLLTDDVWNFTTGGTNPYYTELGKSYNSALSGSTTSVAEIKLRNVTVKSKTDNITNLKIDGTKYTFNFYHKQDANMTTTIKMYATENNTVKAFNDIVITGQQAFKNYEASFIPTQYVNYTIEIVVTSTASVGYSYIYDMMLNAGDKQSWQPSSDEIYSTTLQMSRLGLQVYSSGDGTLTLLGSDGLLTYETTDGITKGALISKRTADGDITRNITTQSVRLTSDITKENVDKWVETTLKLNNKLYKVEYIESGGQ